MDLTESERNAERQRRYRERKRSVESVTLNLNEAPGVTVGAVFIHHVDPHSVTVIEAVTHVPAALLEREARMGHIADWSGQVWINRLGMMTGRLADVPLADMGNIPIGGRPEILGHVKADGRMVSVEALDELAGDIDPTAECVPMRSKFAVLIAGAA
jgi:hypothetical protein